MFSMKEKQFIAQKLEEILLGLKHPEMPTERPKFSLHVDGKEPWSWADIAPNWTFGGKEPPAGAWNEVARDVMEGDSHGEKFR